MEISNNQESPVNNDHLSEENKVLNDFHLKDSIYADEDTKKLVNKICKTLFRDAGYEIDQNQNKDIEKIKNEIKNSNIPKKFQVKFINEEIKFGLFVSEGQVIECGELIGTYEGKIEFSEEIDGDYRYILLNPTTINSFLKCKRKSRKKTYENAIKEKANSLKNAHLILDAKEHGNFTRFINHSPPEEANCITDVKTIENKQILIVSATKKINSGEQVLMDYGEEFWKNRQTEIVMLDPKTFFLKDGHIQKNADKQKQNKRKCEESINETIPKKRIQSDKKNTLIHPEISSDSENELVHS